MAIKKDTWTSFGRTDAEEEFNKDGLFDELKKALPSVFSTPNSTTMLESGPTRGGGTIATGSFDEDRSNRDREARSSGFHAIGKATFDPKLIGRSRRFPGFDDEDRVDVCARHDHAGDSGPLMELYGLEVSPDLISTVTDAVLETVAEWQNRPLEASYPLVFFDAMRVKIRDEGMVRNKAVYIALGVQADGTKDILGLWIENTEGAKFWLRVMNELRNRGVGDILIAVVDGLKGFPEAINAVFPETIIQTCVVHLIRHSLEFVSWKDRKPVVPALRMIYRAKDADAGKAALDAFDAGPGGENIPPSRRPGGATGTESIPFFAFPEAVRRIIYTTNAIEALNAKLRRAVKIRGHFPNDEAATKLIYLVLRQTATEWKMSPREWGEAKTQFAIMFDDRFILA